MLRYAKWCVRLVPTMVLVLMISGCGLVLPTPSHKEIIQIDGDVTNSQLTDRLLYILEVQNLTKCRGPSHKDNVPDCSIPWWQGNPTRVDREQAVIIVGDFPTYTASIIGHSARFRRLSQDRLEITVKGVSAYYHSLPNTDVARKLATIIQDGMSHLKDL